MMKIFGISLLAGLAAAGFVWYGWDLTENLRAWMASHSNDESEGEAEDELADNDAQAPGGIR